MDYLKKLILHLLVPMIVWAAENNTVKVNYLPPANYLYYYDFSVGYFGDTLGKVNPTLIFSSDKRADKADEFINVVKYVKNISPPEDISVLTKLAMNAMGNVGFWEKKYSENDVFNANLLSENIVLFPYFTKSEYKIGEVWEVEIPLPTVFVNNNNGSRYISNHLIKVDQKINKIINMLGFNCVEISYTFSDTATIESKVLRLKGNGKVYFSIKEGIIVSDLMEIEIGYLSFGDYYDYNSNKMSTGIVALSTYYKKKLRLISTLK